MISMGLEIIRGQNFSSNSFILRSECAKKILIIDLGLSGKFSNFLLQKRVAEIYDQTTLEIEVFLTHCHIDHILGFDNLKPYSNVIFSASKNTANHINQRDHVTLLEMMKQAQIDFTVTKVYKDREILQLGNRELEIIYSPGHTDGCAVVYDRINKALFSGDVVFAGGASGRVDLPSGNQQQLLSSLELLANLEVNHLYSGHGIDLHNNVQENILTAKNGLQEWY